MRFIQLRSAPAQNAVPLAASTMQRTSSRSLSFRNSAVSSAMTSSLKALRTSGRLSVTVATAPVVLTAQCCMVFLRFGPDDGAVHGIELARRRAGSIASDHRAFHGVRRHSGLAGNQRPGAEPVTAG